MHIFNTNATLTTNLQLLIMQEDALPADLSIEIRKLREELAAENEVIQILSNELEKFKKELV